MKYLRLVIRNAGRNKRRTLLTVLSISVSIFLLATMRAAIVTLNGLNRVSGGELRVVVRRNTSLGDSMPEAYRDKIAQLQGVSQVCPVNWFGGIYKEDKPKYFIAQFYVDANNIFDVMSDDTIPADQLAAFKQERMAAVAGAKVAADQGWKIGDVIELKGTIYPVNPRLILRGIFTGPDQTSFYFHREYVEEAMGRPGQVGTYFVRLDSPGIAPQVMQEIDDKFANSSAPTKTETEKAFQASFVSMMGNVTGLITGIGLVVVFAITLISANTMALSARERSTEVSVMKAIGFTPGLILTLIVSEAALISLVGGALGVFGARILYQFTTPNFGGFLQDFSISPGIIGLSLLASVALGILSGGIPAWGAARIRIVDGLRRVG
ncbi:MAG TPA: ABC transporter permease [Blastocatellia bacterium]|nr:ABC transporter permease [Blastocatellia bacterium]